MGLDMYLNGDQFLWSFDKKHKLKSELNNLFPEKSYPATNVIFQIGYWRKANAIHNWFVENVQNKVDDCGEYNVTSDQLQDLKEVCELALKNDKDCDILPTKSGFFFGNTEHDEWYFQSLKDTIKIVDDALEFIDKYGCVTYQSSW